MPDNSEDWDDPCWDQCGHVKENKKLKEELAALKGSMKTPEWFQRINISKQLQDENKRLEQELADERQRHWDLAKAFLYRGPELQQRLKRCSNDYLKMHQAYGAENLARELFEKITHELGDQLDKVRAIIDEKPPEYYMHGDGDGAFEQSQLERIKAVLKGGKQWMPDEYNDDIEPCWHNCSTVDALIKEKEQLEERLAGIKSSTKSQKDALGIGIMLCEILGVDKFWKLGVVVPPMNRKIKESLAIINEWKQHPSRIRDKDELIARAKVINKVQKILKGGEQEPAPHCEKCECFGEGRDDIFAREQPECEHPNAENVEGCPKQEPITQDCRECIYHGISAAGRDWCSHYDLPLCEPLMPGHEYCSEFKERDA